MKFELDQSQIDFYNENGFVAIEDFLDAEELAHWRTVTDEAVQQRLDFIDNLTNPDFSSTLSNTIDKGSYYASVFTQCVKLADTHDGMREIILDERLGQLAGTLAGVDGIRIWHDQALIKQPYGNPTGWHLDNPYWSFHSPNAISLWVALDDATLGNGCMWYVPGTHKTARFDNVGIGQDLGALFKVYPEWRSIPTVSVPLRAGSAALHNGLTAHGAGANMTNGKRRAMTCAYMPDGSVFNGQDNVLPKEYLATLKIGDKIDDPNIVPLVWHR